MERRRENYHVKHCQSPKSRDFQDQPKRSQKRHWSDCEVEYRSEENGRGSEEKIGRTGEGEQAFARGGEKGKASFGPEPSEETKKARITSTTIRSLRSRLGLSQADFGKLAGVTTGAVYLWESKEGPLNLRDKTKAALLSFVDVCLHGFELMKRRFESAEKMTEGRPPAERIMAFFDAYVSFFFENRDYYELIERLQINREKLRIPEELMERIKQASSVSLAPMVRAVSAGGGERAEEKTFEQVILFVAFAEGLFQCLRKGLLDRTGVPFGNVRSLILSKLPGLLEG
jgi:DNA-binding transcriptional regulator YiaG